MLGTSGRTGPRPPPTANIDVLERQLQGGDVEMNATVMSREELIQWAKKLKESAHRVKSLRILCVPRGIMWSQYHFSQMQRHIAGQHIYSTPEHKMGVKVASANVQHHLVRMAFYKAVCAVVRRAPLEELVLGLRFSESGCTMLSDALAVNTTLKRLSFAGSHLADERVMWLKPGLIANNSLEELDLTACNLTDEAARSVASVIKAHVDRRLALVFDEQLRQYPDSSLPQHKAHLQYHAQLRAIARNVDQTCGGLLHLELAENRLTDQAVKALCTALSYDRRLIFLSLRANKQTAAAEAELVSLMKEHQALLRVDLRQNADPKLGILKLKRRVAPRVFSAALGFQPNPGAVGLNSPARTNTSMPLWALREEIPDSLGPTPMATPRPVAPNSPGRMSTVSWGDLHLLVRGAPPGTAAAAARGGPGGSRGRRGGRGAGGAPSGKAGWVQRAASAGRRRQGSSGGGGEREENGSGGSGAPASPRGKYGAQHQEPPPPPVPQQQAGQGLPGRAEQLWADREVTLSGEPAVQGAVGGGPGASGVYDTPLRRTGTGAGDSDIVLQASGHGDIAAAAAAAAAAASLVTGIPVPLASGDSFGLGAPALSGPPPSQQAVAGLAGSGASWVAPPTAVSPWQRSMPMSASEAGTWGAGPSPVSARTVSERALDRVAAVAAAGYAMGPGGGGGAGGQGPLPGQPLPLGRSPLSRVTGPLTSPGGGSVGGSNVSGGRGDGGDDGGGVGGGSGGGGVPWVWGRPVNPDGSDMVVLTPTASPPRRPAATGGSAAPPAASLAGMQQPLRPRPYTFPVPAGLDSAPMSVTDAGPPPNTAPPPPAPSAPASSAQQPAQPRSGWIHLPDSGGVAWLAMPVPIAGLSAPPLPSQQQRPSPQLQAAASAAAAVAPLPLPRARWPGAIGAAAATQPYGAGALPITDQATEGYAPGAAGGQYGIGNAAGAGLMGSGADGSGVYGSAQYRQGALPPVHMGWWSRGDTGDGAASAAVGPGAAMDAADSRRQAAFLSMLHREGLTPAQGSYDYLFSGRHQHPGQQRSSEALQGQRRSGGGRAGGRAAVKRRQPTTTTPTRTRTPVRRRATRSASRSPPSRSQSRSPSRAPPRSLSRSRTSSPPSRATPTRHRTTSYRTVSRGSTASPNVKGTRSVSRRGTAGVRAGGTGGSGGRGAGGGGSASVVRRKTPGRNGLAFRSGRRVKARRNRGSASAKKTDARGRREASAGAAASSPRRRRSRGRRRSPGRAGDVSPLGAKPPGIMFGMDPEELAALERSLLQMAAEVSALEAAAEASRAAAVEAAEREAEERAAAMDAGRAAAEAAERAAVSAETAQRAAVTAVDRAAVAERTAKDAVRRVRKVEASVRRPVPSPRPPTDAVVTNPGAPSDFGAALPGLRRDGHPPLLVQLQPHSSVRQYDGAARGNGVNVNTIIQQLDRWCGLCDDALLQPPAPPPSQEQQPPPRVQSPLRSLQAKMKHPSQPLQQPQQLPAYHQQQPGQPAKVQLPCSPSRSRSPQRR